MDTVERLSAALREDQGVHALTDLGVDHEPLAGIDFAGAKDHWGSVGLVGLVRADGLDETAIDDRLRTFDALTGSLHEHTGVVRFFTPGGDASVELGSFGVICFVFESGCARELSDAIRQRQRRAARKKRYTLAWSADVPAGRVRDHGLLPRGVFPSKRWVESIIRSQSIPA